MKQANDDQKVVFGLSSDGKMPIIVLGVSKVAYDFMTENKSTTTFDFSNVGLPIKIIMFASEDKAEALATITQNSEVQGHTIIDKTKTDFSFKD